MESFTKHYDADEAWPIKPEGAAREIQLLGERKDDVVPQGREAVVKFMKKCQKKGWGFVVKAKYTKPHTTRYFEVDPASYFSEGDKKAFMETPACDEHWDIEPSGAAREIDLMNQRKDEIYPQGRENITKFLKMCEKKGWRFRNKAKYTKPHTTRYFELIPESVFTSDEKKAFMSTPKCDEQWLIEPAGALREIDLMNQRKNEIYPQGRENIAKFIRMCAKKGLRFYNKAKYTKPNTTRYFELDHTSVLAMKGLGDFAKNHDCDEKWEINPDGAKREIELMEQRASENYPQGRKECKKFLKLCAKKGYRLVNKAKYTKPNTTRYFEVILP